MIWISLWPVFSSCSPTYAVILAVILPVSFLVWLINLFAYALWLWIILLLIALLWQKFILKLKWASSPNGIFKKVLGILFLIIWLSIIMWWDKDIESYIISKWFINTYEFEQNILDKVNK